MLAATHHDGIAKLRPKRKELPVSLRCGKVKVA